MRRYAREVVLGLTFEYLFTNTKNDLQLDMFDQSKISKDDMPYIRNTYNGILENLPDFQAEVSKYLRGYTLERITKVDQAILVYAIYELSHTRIPLEIVINEAVELAKKYSTDKGVGFVNGVLAEYIKNQGGKSNG